MHTRRLPRRMSRRLFLFDAGRGAVGAAVLATGLAACGGDDDPTAGDPSGATRSPVQGADSTPPAGLGGTAWHRVSFGFVSAYVLARGGEAAVVDTGVADSAGEIEAALSGLGLGWDAVGHVILTHAHPDHVGSLADVMERAAAASAYAGAADIPSMRSPRAVQAVGDGDRVFDLEIIETPGHTPGHISVLDPVARLLVAGDAMNGAGGGVTGPNSQFTADMDRARTSVSRLGERSFDILVFGHGEPVLAGASAAVAALARAN